jgi:solute carrier family 35 protein E1
VETAKAAEPLSTVVIGLLLMNEAYNAATYGSLLPICGGVAMACYSSDSFVVQGFLLAMASNFCFSARGVFAKMLNTAHPNAVDDINLFYAISVRGLVLLLPLALLMEGRTLLGILAGEGIGGGEDVTGSALAGSGGAWVWVLALAALNGSMFAGYNLTSYMVLRRTSLVTHSVLTAFRRVFVIVFTTLYFRAQPTALGMGGVALATAGVLLFSAVRRQAGKAESAEGKPGEAA